MKLPGVLGLLFILGGGVVKATTVYRCVGAEGVPTYQQLPCAGQGGQIRLAEPAARWEALHPGERALLEDRRSGERPRQGGVPVKQRRGTTAKASERSCWQKRRHLDAVSAKLRRGYKPAQGERLRRRRDDLADFLSRYCD